jgi:hypothetical protein
MKTSYFTIFLIVIDHCSDFLSPFTYILGINYNPFIQCNNPPLNIGSMILSEQSIEIYSTQT